VLGAIGLLTAGAAPALAATGNLGASVLSAPAPGLLGDDPRSNPTPTTQQDGVGDDEAADEPLDDHAATGVGPGLGDALAGAVYALPGALIALAGVALARAQRPPRARRQRASGPEAAAPPSSDPGDPGPNAEPVLEAPPPEGVDGVLRVAQAFLDRGDERAAARLAIAVDLAPERSTPHTCRGIALERLGRTEEALAANEGARRAGAGAEPAYRQARLLAREGEPGRALARLREAVDEEPALPEDAAGDEAFDALRDRPRFLALVGRL
jgi:tetratricopeptide (TPR) repeat protein